MARRYAILDVFTETPLEGNPLAIVLDCGGLTDAAMQQIAAEFNLSETVFVLPPAHPPHAAAIRIFTPREELPFAGHPTIGTAVLLAAERTGTGSGDALLILEEKIGAIRCGVTVKTNGGHAWFDAPRLPAPVEREMDKDQIAEALGLSPQEIGFENHVPSAYGAGMSFNFVPVANLAVIARAEPNTNVWRRVFVGDPVYLYTRETVAVARQFHVRVFAPDLGIAEDPATGAGATAFAGVVDRFDAHRAGTHKIVVEQGFEMGRPSLIAIEMDIEAGRVAEVRIGGAAVIVAHGTLDA
jgi:trans-2,3-dihydro-3-hydroxyanthranilate isomerase